MNKIAGIAREDHVHDLRIYLPKNLVLMDPVFARSNGERIVITKGRQVGPTWFASNPFAYHMVPGAYTEVITI